VRLSPRIVLRTTLWVILLGLGGCAAYERAEDASCARIQADLPLMTPGPVKNAAVVMDVACAGEEAAEDAGVDAGK